MQYLYNSVKYGLRVWVSFKRVKKYKLKFKSKPRITLGLQKSISVKNKLLINLINKKDPILKAGLAVSGVQSHMHTPIHAIFCLAVRSLHA